MSKQNELLEQDVRKSKLAQWFEADKQLKHFRALEMKLRNEIFNGTFTQPVEGSKNEFDLEDGFILKAEHRLNRNIDEGALGALLETMRERGINTDALFKYKPSLSITDYRKLSEEDLKFVDQCLIIKEGSPVLSIIPNKKAK